MMVIFFHFFFFDLGFPGKFHLLIFFFDLGFVSGLHFSAPTPRNHNLIEGEEVFF